MDDEETDGTHSDSTGNGNVGIQNRNNNTEGVISNGQDFDGSNDYIEVDQSGLQITGAAITIEAWARPTGNPNAFWHVYGAGSTGHYWQCWWTNQDDGWSTRFRIGTQEEGIWTDQGDDSGWNYLASRYDGVFVMLFLDGTRIGEQLRLGWLSAINTPFRIGDNPSLSPREFEGIIDEVRISDVARPAAWIAAQHKSMSDDNFVLYGPEEIH